MAWDFLRNTWQGAQDNPDALVRIASAFTPRQYRPAMLGLSGIVGMSKAGGRQEDWARSRERVDRWEEARKRGTPLPDSEKPTPEDMYRARSAPPTSATDIGFGTAENVANDYVGQQREKSVQNEDARKRALAELMQSPQVIPARQQAPQSQQKPMLNEQILMKLIMALMRRQHGQQYG